MKWSFGKELMSSKSKFCKVSTALMPELLQIILFHMSWQLSHCHICKIVTRVHFLDKSYNKMIFIKNSNIAPQNSCRNKSWFSVQCYKPTCPSISLMVHPFLYLSITEKSWLTDYNISCFEKHFLSLLGWINISEHAMWSLQRYPYSLVFCQCGLGL